MKSKIKVGGVKTSELLKPTKTKNNGKKDYDKKEHTKENPKRISKSKSVKCYNKCSLKKTIVSVLVIIGGILLSQIYNRDVKEKTVTDNNRETKSSIDEIINPKTIYEFQVHDIYGNRVDMNIYRGQVSIIVNVASECGYTETNYHDFTLLKNVKINGKPIRILAFPCNQFGGQEPGSNEEIIEFAKSRRAPFDLFEKIDVFGPDAHPLFEFLQASRGEIRWNFYKFIINGDGVPAAMLASDAYYDDMYAILQDLFDAIE